MVSDERAALSAINAVLVRHLDRAFEPLSNLTVPGAGRVLGRVRAEAGAVLCGDQGIAIEIGDERTGIPFDRLVVDWPPLLAWAELQRKGRGVLVLGTAEKKWALELDSLSFSGLVNALRVVGKDEPASFGAP